MKQMAPMKAPDPDGMPSLFSHHFWNILDSDVTFSILSAEPRYPTSSLKSYLCCTHSKDKILSICTNFDQLAFVMCYSNFFSKVLANRLKTLLPTIITEHQSSFTKYHLISDNILVAFETSHSMQKYNPTKSGFMATILDMIKAYDHVEWSFLEELKKKIGFNERWIHLTMLCVKIVTYSILINDEPRGLIHPTRGIRQRDPLSPFLFLLCIEGLNGLIKHA